MTPQPLRVQCPSCASSDITYTCEPKCCFNHICVDCYTTFELSTEALGWTRADLQTPLEERDCLAATVACARCGSVEVYMLTPADGAPEELICLACRATLRLRIDAVERH